MNMQISCQLLWRPGQLAGHRKNACFEADPNVSASSCKLAIVQPYLWRVHKSWRKPPLLSAMGMLSKLNAIWARHTYNSAVLK